MLKIKIAKVLFSQKCNVGAGYDAWRRLIRLTEGVNPGYDAWRR
jgi:hypothetical protein